MTWDIAKSNFSSYALCSRRTNDCFKLAGWMDAKRPRIGSGGGCSLLARGRAGTFLSQYGRIAWAERANDLCVTTACVHQNPKSLVVHMKFVWWVRDARANRRKEGRYRESVSVLWAHICYLCLLVIGAGPGGCVHFGATCDICIYTSAFMTVPANYTNNNRQTAIFRSLHA